MKVTAWVFTRVQCRQHRLLNLDVLLVDHNTPCSASFFDPASNVFFAMWFDIVPFKVCSLASSGSTFPRPKLDYHLFLGAFVKVISSFRSDQLSCIHPTTGQQFHDVQPATKLWTTLCGAAAIQWGPDLRFRRFRKGEANATKGWNMMKTYDFHRRGLLRTLLVQCLWNWWPMRSFLNAFIEMKWFKGYYWYMMVHSNANTQEVPLQMYTAMGPSFLHSIAQALQAFATVSCGMFTWQSRW